MCELVDSPDGCSTCGSIDFRWDATGQMHCSKCTPGRRLEILRLKRRCLEFFPFNRSNWRRSYNAYLKSPQWKAKRERMIGSQSGSCEMCGQTKLARQLQLHHRTYDHIGCEPDGDLQILCEKCHQKADRLRKVMNSFEYQQVRNDDFEYTLDEYYDSHYD